jgi:hypothetical protein
MLLETARAKKTVIYFAALVSYIDEFFNVAFTTQVGCGLTLKTIEYAVTACRGINTPTYFPTETVSM